MRTLKSPLSERPVFHRREGRVEAHIFRCLPATGGGLVLRIRKGTLPEPAHRERYAKLGIQPEVIRPHKRLTRNDVSKS